MHLHIPRPLQSPQLQARRNARVALMEARMRRAEREDVEAFLSRVLPEQRRRAARQRA
jgi:hypothetical protein